MSTQGLHSRDVSSQAISSVFACTIKTRTIITHIGEGLGTEASNSGVCRQVR